MMTIADIAYATEKSETISASAYKIGNIFGIPITNSIITGWLVSTLFIVFIFYFIKPELSIKPSRRQVLLEFLLIGIRDIIKAIVGKKMINCTFPILISFFIFILLQNLSGLLPGIGAFGSEIDENFLYYLRPSSSDMNTTLALALIAMVVWLYFVIRYAGIKFFLKDVFGNKAIKKEISSFIYFILYFIFLLVGCVEILSIIFRPISLSLRLYGNVFGGENLLMSITRLFPWGLPVPFYFLEGLVAVVQAFVFTLLTAVYIGLICNHDE